MIMLFDQETSRNHEILGPWITRTITFKGVRRYRLDQAQTSRFLDLGTGLCGDVPGVFLATKQLRNKLLSGPKPHEAAVSFWIVPSFVDTSPSFASRTFRHPKKASLHQRRV